MRTVFHISLLVFGLSAAACSTTPNSSPDGSTPVDGTSDGTVPPGDHTVADALRGDSTPTDVPASSPDAAGSDAAPHPDVVTVVGACNQLPAAGTWQNITPPALQMSEWCVPYTTNCPQPAQTMNGQMGTYGTNAFVVDPINLGTVYLGTSSMGIWKSTDCGSTWAHIDTGMNGATLDAGRNWTMVIDPTNSQVIYTVAGYGQGGVFKSTDGGVNWTQILTQNVLDATGATPCSQSPDPQVCGNFGAFMEKITMDPTNNTHLLVGFHSDCAGTTPLPGATVDSAGGWGCLAESMDAGATWTLTTSAVPWSGLDGPGQTMINATTWFYATNGGSGLWRTSTGGVSTGGNPAWTQVYNGSVNGGVYVASDGTYYAGGNNIILSTDQGTTWNAIANSPSAGSMNGSSPMVDDGTLLYFGDNGGYWTTPIGGSPTITMIASTPVAPDAGGSPLADVAYVAYDPAHHLLYSSNMDGGFWRYVAQ